MTETASKNETLRQISYQWQLFSAAINAYNTLSRGWFTDSIRTKVSPMSKNFWQWKSPKHPDTNLEIVFNVIGYFNVKYCNMKQTYKLFVFIIHKSSSGLIYNQYHQSLAN